MPCAGKIVGPLVPPAAKRRLFGNDQLPQPAIRDWCRHAKSQAKCHLGSTGILALWAESDPSFFLSHTSVSVSSTKRLRPALARCVHSEYVGRKGSAADHLRRAGTALIIFGVYTKHILQDIQGKL